MLARVLDDQPAVGRALLLLGNLAMMRGAFDHARALREEALATFEQLGDQPSIAVSHINIGMDLYRQGDIARPGRCTRGQSPPRRPRHRQGISGTPSLRSD